MKIIVIAMTIIVCQTVIAGATDTQERTAASRAVVKSFMQELKGELQQAMKAGGPTNAIEVCKTKAPKIAADHSNKQGWRVARTSLKVRNPGNAPDAWERKVLKSFEARKAEGEDITKMEYAEVVTQNGKQTFRYMKAIPTGQVCLNCHGAKIDAATEAKLKQVYPADMARGFSVGDIRVAFTISQPM